MARATAAPPYADPISRRLGSGMTPPPGVPGMPYNPNAGAGASGSALANIQPAPVIGASPTPAPADPVAARAWFQGGAAQRAAMGLPEEDASPSAAPSAAAPAAADVPAPAPPPGGRAPGDVGDTVGRALIAFSHGMAATPSGAAYNPLGGAIAGGLAGAGESYKDTLDRRMAMWRMQNEPLLAARAAGLKTAAEKQAADPYEAAQQGRMLDRQTQDIKLKASLNAAMIAKAGQGLKPADALAMNKQAEQDVLLQGVDPSSSQFGDAVAARVVQLANQANALGANKVNPQAPAAPKAAAGRPPLDSFVK